IRDDLVTGVQTCALPIYVGPQSRPTGGPRGGSIGPTAREIDPFDVPRPIEHGATIGRTGPCDAGRAPDNVLGDARPGSLGDLAEIGRASCRERRWGWAGG